VTIPNRHPESYGLDSSGRPPPQFLRTLARPVPGCVAQGASGVSAVQTVDLQQTVDRRTDDAFYCRAPAPHAASVREVVDRA